MDTRIDNVIYVHSKTDERSIRFQQCHDRNLYYLDLENLDINGTCLFTPLDEKRARTVQKLQEMCRSPSDADFIQALEQHKIPGVDFTKRDVRVAKDLLGYSEFAAKGKMKHPRKGVQMTDNTEKYSDIPTEVHKHYKEIHLDIDVMYINKIPFLVVVSKSIGMIHYISVMNKDNKRVSNTLTSIISQYNGRGFKVSTIHGDGAFDSLKDWAMNTHKVQLTVCGADGRIPQAENAIKFIKERVRCIQCNMPFKRLPCAITIEMALRATTLINSFNCKGNVHPVLSAREIVTEGRFVTPIGHFGDIVMAYNTKASNDTGTQRAVYSLYIRPNGAGTAHYVYNMTTKQVISSPKIIMKEMDQAFVDLIDKIGKEEKQPVGVEFQSLSGQTIEDIYDLAWNNPDYVPSATEQYEDQQDEDYKYSLSRDTALYHDQDVDDNKLNGLEYELDKSLLPYQPRTNNKTSSIGSDKTRSVDVPELNELEDDENVMNIEVQDKDDNYQEQYDQPDKKYENTPYAGESQQDYFGNVDDTPTTNIDEASVLSTYEQPHRACHKAANYKYIE